MSRKVVKPRMGPKIVTPSRATAIAVARFGPPPATAAQVPRHCGGRSVRKGGLRRLMLIAPFAPGPQPALRLLVGSFCARFGGALSPPQPLHIELIARFAAASHCLNCSS